MVSYTSLDEVKQRINVKHLEASPKFDTLLLYGPINEIRKIVFDEITENLIQKASIRTKEQLIKFGADDWRRILSLNVLGNLELRRSFARMIEAMFPETDSQHG